MENIGVVFLIESLFWTPERRDAIVGKWVTSAFDVSTPIVENISKCIRYMLYSPVQFCLGTQMLSIFGKKKLPVLFTSMTPKERVNVFHIFRHRETLFRTETRLAGSMMLLENSTADEMIENLIPRKSMVISYLKGLLSAVGVGVRYSVQLAVRQILRDHPRDHFLQSLENFAQSRLCGLFELDYLPGDLGVKPSKRERDLNIDWEVIIRDLTQKTRSKIGKNSGVTKNAAGKRVHAVVTKEKRATLSPLSTLPVRRLHKPTTCTVRSALNVR